MPDAPKYAAAMTEIEFHIGAALRHEGVPEHQAMRLTGAVVKGLCQTLGGRQVYIPRGEARNTQARNAEIVREYDNTPESVTRLAQAHNLTEIHIYRILAAHRRQRRAAH
jgi:Mor family transcriptional regulator